jgi:serine-type D-Ala-D-Ala carboxypeptidase (penicillin-binding protein 5/6)
MDMDISEPQQEALERHGMRDLGIALVTASAVLAVFLLIPVTPPGGSQPAAVVVAAPSAPNAYAQVPVQAVSAIVYDLTTGETLYAKNSDAQLPLASLTKLLAVYAALTQFPTNAPITISEAVTRVDAPHAFREGQVFSLDDISRLTLTASLNDGAAAIVEAAAARENNTPSEALARAASELNLTSTYAVNGNGLDVNQTISGGYGSARDVAHLAGALVEKAPQIALATTKSSAYAVSKGGTAYTVKNTDPVVGNITHLLLSKTGFTDLAGGNLALVFDVGINHPVAVVVLGSSVDARFTDATALVAATHAHFAGVASL